LPVGRNITKKSAWCRRPDLPVFPEGAVKIRAWTVHFETVRQSGGKFTKGIADRGLRNHEKSVCILTGPAAERVVAGLEKNSHKVCKKYHNI